ncbi:MAG: hypothetical protein PUE59_06655 [Treponema sp.]|nr:hypothetical protein [Treponema sp.]
MRFTIVDTTALNNFSSLRSEGHVLAIMFSAMSLVICGIGSKLLDKIGNFLDGKTIGKK